VIGLAARARWYAQRLGAMSGPEILFRVGESWRRQRDRGFIVPYPIAPRGVDHPSPCLLAPTRGERVLLRDLPGLRDGLLAWDVPAAAIAAWKAQYEAARAGKFRLLGQSWPGCALDACWHLDPVSGNAWPSRTYCFDIKYRHAPGMGDVKYVWELNRLQYLQPVAALACVTSNAHVGRLCGAHIESWMAENPPHLGVNWASGIELALRAVSLLVVASLAGPYITEAVREKMLASLHAHGHWLARYPSRFSSANNHRTAEALGLLAIGALCPYLAEAGRWADSGWATLCADARDQILSDGVGAEQAVTYTAMEVEMLLLGRHLAAATGRPVPASFDDRLNLAGDYLRWLTDAGGGQPRIGDDDNGCVLGLHAPDYASSVLGSVASAMQRPALTPPRLAPHLRQAVFGVAPAAAAPPAGVRHFDRGGYSVWRWASQGRAVLLAFDHGPLGYLSIAAHGHADTLSIWLHVGDQPVLVDAGTYLYHSGGTWRGHFRGTAAHNTLCLEGADSSVMAGPFNWSRHARARLLGAGEHWAEAAHDGYARRFGAVHRRRVERSADGGFWVRDQLDGGRARPVSINFLLHPALTARLEKGALRIQKDGVDMVEIGHQGRLAPFIGRAGSRDGGWYSPGFGEKQEAWRLGYRGQLRPGEASIARFDFIR
jgi:hypothetical protein